MKRYLLFAFSILISQFSILISPFSIQQTASAVVKVSYDELQRDGWSQYKGQFVCLTTPLVVCGTMYDSLILAPERLYVPDEHAYGLADGDSTEYFRLARHNATIRVKLECKYPFSLTLGSTITNLKARVMGERHLQTGAEPRFKMYRPSTKLPDMGEHDLLICSANIQNYFVHVGGYATRRNTQGQHTLQCYKVASALARFHADLYTLCELEKGLTAPRELTEHINALLHTDAYEFVHTDSIDGDTISVGFIYNKHRLRPYGPLRFAYDRNDNNTRVYAYRFMIQGFESVQTGERFVVSLNHPRSKRGTPQQANAKRMANVEHILQAIQSAYDSGDYNDPDILLLGDYNSYSLEQPIQTIIRAGYEDVLMHNDSNNYSYSYRGECGYLDRVFASPSMARQVVAVHPVHWNTDFYYSAAYYSKYNFKKQNIPYKVEQPTIKAFPRNIRRVMTPTAKRNLLFRFSDHDPILISLTTTPPPL